MKLLCFHITFVCLLQLHFSLGRSVQNNGRHTCPSVDCSKYKDDNDIMESLSISPEDDPIFDGSLSAYANWNIADQTVRVLNIVGRKSLEPSIFCLQSLEELYIRGSHFNVKYTIRAFPPGIQCLARTLKVLVIENVPFSHLPDEISQLKQLMSIDVSNAGLVSLPDTIGDLPFLNSLYLRNNQLSSLPESLKKNRNLQIITVSNNPNLRSLASLNDHPSLESLTAENCSIEQLPVRLKMLIKLLMGNNKLKNLNDIQTIGSEQPKGKLFFFQNNQIKSLRWNIRLVKNLSRLSLNHNQLRNLPEAIFHVKTLTYLDIQSNHLDSRKSEIIDRFKRTNSNLTLKC